MSCTYAWLVEHRERTAHRLCRLVISLPVGSSCLPCFLLGQAHLTSVHPGSSSLFSGKESSTCRRRERTWGGEVPLTVGYMRDDLNTPNQTSDALNPLGTVVSRAYSRQLLPVVLSHFGGAATTIPCTFFLQKFIELSHSLLKSFRFFFIVSLKHFNSFTAVLWFYIYSF